MQPYLGRFGFSHCSGHGHYAWHADRSTSVPSNFPDFCSPRIEPQRPGLCPVMTLVRMRHLWALGTFSPASEILNILAMTPDNTITEQQDRLRAH